MKTLVVFYSRTGNTKKVAKRIMDKINADMEELIDIVNRKGIIGWLRGGYDAFKKKNTNIKNVRHNPKNYDLIIIGSPIWAGNTTPAVRTFLEKNKQNIKQVAFFCTSGSGNDEKFFRDMQSITEKEPIACLSIKTKNIKKNNFENKITHFTEKILK